VAEEDAGAARLELGEAVERGVHRHPIVHARRPEDSCTHFATRAAGSARFVLIGESFHGANGPCGLGGLRFVALLLSEQLLGLLAVELVDGVALHVRIEYFQGPAAGIDFVVVGEFGKPFEDAEQVFVPRGAQDLHIAGAALRAEWPEPRQLVAAFGGRRDAEAAKGAYQMTT